MQGEWKVLIKNEKQSTAKTASLDNSRPLRHRDIRSLFTEKGKKVRDEAFVVTEKLIDLIEATTSQDPGSGSQELSSTFNDHSKEQCGTFSSQSPRSVNKLVNSSVGEDHRSQEIVTFTDNLIIFQETKHRELTIVNVVNECVRESDTCYPEDISELLLNQAEVNAELETESVEYSDFKDDLEEL